MKLKQWFKGLFAPLMVIVLIMGSAMSARADIVYDNIPSSLADNYPSLGYQATQTDEFGDRISLTNGGLLNNVTFTLSSWARSEDYNNAAGQYFDIGGSVIWENTIATNVYSAVFYSESIGFGSALSDGQTNLEYIVGGRFQ
jgi:hypothetical protein